MSTAIPLNGVRLNIRLIEIELLKLRLDPENPRLHSAYLTRELPAHPNEQQIAQVLEQLPEFRPLLDSLTRNKGCHQPPLVTEDYRVLEGNRRITAMRKLQAEHPNHKQWETVTVQQLVKRVTPEQEQMLRSRFHLDYVESRVNTHPSVRLRQAGLPEPHENRGGDQVLW